MPDLPQLNDPNAVNSINDILKSDTKRVAFYGGSFWPIHAGHLSVAITALDKFVDKVIFCPHSLNTGKNIPLSSLKINAENILAYIKDSEYRDQLQVASPSFLHGIQNTNFVELVDKLRTKDITSYVIIGTDALKDNYPEFMKKIPHLVAPRPGYVSNADVILGKNYYLLDNSKIQSCLHRLSVKNLIEILEDKDFFESKGISIRLFSSDSDTGNIEILGEALVQIEDLYYSDLCLKQVLNTIGKYESIYGLSKDIEKAHKSGKVFPIPENARIALCMLGKVFEIKGHHKVAEECILNASFNSNNPDILFYAGCFYLIKKQLELSTAISFFIQTCQFDQGYVEKCEKAIDDLFLKQITNELLFNPYTRFVLKEWQKFRNEM